MIHLHPGTYPLTFPIVIRHRGKPVRWRTMFGEIREGQYIGVCRYDRMLAEVRAENGIVTVNRKSFL